MLGAMTAALIILAFSFPASPPARGASGDPAQVVGRFFRAINTRQYAKAYGLLGRSIHQEVGSVRFSAEAAKVVSARLLELVSTERSPYLARFHIKARLEILRDGQRMVGIYSGRSSLHLEEGHWKVIYVELDPTQAQASDKTVDFGTR